MKKLLLTVALIGAVTAGYSQGVVNLANAGNLVSFKPLTGDATVLPPSATTPYRFALLVAPSTVTGFVPLAAGSNADAWGATETSLAGYTVAGYGVNGASAAAAGRVAFTPATFTIPGFDAGTTVNMVLVGYRGTADWADIVAQTPAPEQAGTSKLVTVLLGGGSIGTPSFFGVGANQAQGFTVNEVVIPEPTSLALLGLGAAGLLIFRRRS